MIVANSKIKQINSQVDQKTIQLESKPNKTNEKLIHLLKITIKLKDLKSGESRWTLCLILFNIENVFNKLNLA